MTIRISAHSYNLPQTWLGRVIGGLLAVALLVLAFFFVFVFLLVAGIVILAIALRVLWRTRKVLAQTTPKVLEGEYSVEPQDKAANITHKH
jgi:hypothetical protein